MIMRNLFRLVSICLIMSSVLSCKETEPAWEGAVDYPHQIFGLKNRRCIVVRPFVKANGKWIVRPAFVGAFPQVDDSLLSKGYTMAYYDVTHEYATPRSQKDFNAFYRIVRFAYRLDKKFIMEGFSRGGFFALTYAENHPERISKLYLDAPVCDLYSWPAQTDSTLYSDAVNKWKESGYQIEEIHDYPLNNIDKILDIPIIVIYGKEDDVVPFDNNFGRIASKGFKELSLIGKEGCGHHPHSLQPCDTIVNFLMK